VLLVYALATHMFWPVILAQLGVTAVLGVFYRFLTRHLPAEQRVSAAALLPAALVMPVTYAILTPLALLTLDSRAWETRGHEAPDEELAAASLPVPSCGSAAPTWPTVRPPESDRVSDPCRRRRRAAEQAP